MKLNRRSKSKGDVSIADSQFEEDSIEITPVMVKIARKNKVKLGRVEIGNDFQEALDEIRNVMTNHGLTMAAIYMGNNLPVKVLYVSNESEDLEETAAADEEELHRDGDDGSVDSRDNVPGLIAPDSQVHDEARDAALTTADEDDKSTVKSVWKSLW